MDNGSVSDRSGRTEGKGRQVQSLYHIGQTYQRFGSRQSISIGVCLGTQYLPALKSKLENSLSGNRTSVVISVDRMVPQGGRP